MTDAPSSSDCSAAPPGTLRQNALKACRPLAAVCELTLQCNLRCPHCYNGDRSRPLQADELSRTEWEKTFEALREAGTLFLTLSGGEPLTHPDFFPLLRRTAELRFAVTLLTNATLIDPPTALRLADAPNLQEVSATFYGARPETHDAFTGMPGSHRRALDGLRTLRDAGVNVTMKFVLLAANHAETADMIRLASGTGARFLFDPCITRRVDGDDTPLSLRCTEAQIAPLYRGPLREHLFVRPKEPGADDWTCACARATCAVTATGDLLPCIAAPWKAGNLREKPLHEIWTGSDVFKTIRNLTLPDFTHCAPCPHKRWCRRNHGAALLNGGNYTGIDPWTCSEAAIIREVLSPE